LRRNIDNRIEPLPFRPEDFDNGEMFAEEIKRTGMRILKKLGGVRARGQRNTV